MADGRPRVPGSAVIALLIEGAQIKGPHNPSFVNAVLNASLCKDLSN